MNISLTIITKRMLVAILQTLPWVSGEASLSRSELAAGSKLRRALFFFLTPSPHSSDPVGSPP